MHASDVSGSNRANLCAKAGKLGPWKSSMTKAFVQPNMKHYKPCSFTGPLWKSQVNVFFSTILFKLHPLSLAAITSRKTDCNFRFRMRMLQIKSRSEKSETLHCVSKEI